METEILVLEVERIVAAWWRRSERWLLIADVGTGSGAILLALLARLPQAVGIGIDIAPDALAWASRNARNLDLAGRATFLRGDLLDPCRPGSLDVVVSNPPYIALGQVDSLAPEIRDHEPAGSLIAGADGLAAIRRLVPQAWRCLRPAGLFALEIGIGQGEAVRALLLSGGWADVTIVPDLTGRPRVVTAVREGTAAR